jgi:hypothetical protein
MIPGAGFGPCLFFPAGLNRRGRWGTAATAGNRENAMKAHKITIDTIRSMLDLAEQNISEVKYGSKVASKEIEFALRQVESLARELRHDIQQQMSCESAAATAA